jgi:hypothetical protein
MEKNTLGKGQFSDACVWLESMLEGANLCNRFERHTWQHKGPSRSRPNELLHTVPRSIAKKEYTQTPLRLQCESSQTTSVSTLKETLRLATHTKTTKLLELVDPHSEFAQLLQTITCTEGDPLRAVGLQVQQPYRARDTSRRHLLQSAHTWRIGVGSTPTAPLLNPVNRGCTRRW